MGANRVKVFVPSAFIRRHRFVFPNDRLLNHAAPNYKNSHPLVNTPRLPLYPDRTSGEHIKKWRLEEGLFQKGLAKRIGVKGMKIVNWEEKQTKPRRKNLERIKEFLRTYGRPSTLLENISPFLS
jgi:DNA-binding transcriptional regulator YiaG